MKSITFQSDADVGAALRGGRGGVLPVTGGYIALQSEGHPIEFKDIQVMVLK